MKHVNYITKKEMAFSELHVPPDELFEMAHSDDFRIKDMAFGYLILLELPINAHTFTLGPDFPVTNRLCQLALLHECNTLMIKEAPTYPNHEIYDHD